MIDAKLAFEATKEIIDGIRAARSWKKSLDRDYFDQVVTPIYDNSKVVFENYIWIFDHLVELLDDEKNGVTQCIKFLMENRRTYQALRVDIRALAGEMEKSSRFQNDQFFTGIGALMKGGASQREGGYVDLSHYGYKRHTILGFVQGMSESEVPASQENLYFQKEARQQIQCLEKAWEDTAEGYASLKHKLLA